MELYKGKVSFVRELACILGLGFWASSPQLTHTKRHLFLQKLEDRKGSLVTLKQTLYGRLGTLFLLQFLPNTRCHRLLIKSTEIQFQFSGLLYILRNMTSYIWNKFSFLDLPLSMKFVMLEADNFTARLVVVPKYFHHQGYKTGRICHRVSLALTEYHCFAIPSNQEDSAAWFILSKMYRHRKWQVYSQNPKETLFHRNLTNISWMKAQLLCRKFGKTLPSFLSKEDMVNLTTMLLYLPFHISDCCPKKYEEMWTFYIGLSMTARRKVGRTRLMSFSSDFFSHNRTFIISDLLLSTAPNDLDVISRNG